jgi:acetyl esterase
MPLDPQVRAHMDSLAALNLPAGTVSPAEARLAMLRRPVPAGAPVARVEDHAVETASGHQIPVRVYVPDGARDQGVLVYFHGGGWVVGDLDTHDHLCRELANAARCAIVAVDYRLAPEHRYPAALDDCEAAYRWVLANAVRFGGSARNVAVAGDSAGGNLAAALCLRARNQQGPPPVFQLLLYPVMDCDFERASYVENGQGYGLTTDGMRWFWDQYLRGPADQSDECAAPLRAADLSGLPPALVITAEFDPLRDEGEAYGERLRAAGVPVEVHRYPGMNHGFMSNFWVVDAGKAAIAESAAALNQAFAAQPAAP